MKDAPPPTWPLATLGMLSVVIALVALGLTPLFGLGGLVGIAAVAIGLWAFARRSGRGLAAVGIALGLAAIALVAAYLAFVEDAGTGSPVG